jgi:hypothetical protein
MQILFSPSPWMVKMMVCCVRFGDEHIGVIQHEREGAQLGSPGALRGNLQAPNPSGNNGRLFTMTKWRMNSLQ